MLGQISTVSSNSSNWITDNSSRSSSSSITATTTDRTLTSARHSSRSQKATHSANRRHTEISPSPLEQYFIEQAKLFNHLEKRFNKFNKKFTEDEKKFKKQNKKNKQNKNTPAKPAASPAKTAPVSKPVPTKKVESKPSAPPIPIPTRSTDNTKVKSSTKETNKETMLASNGIKGAVKRAANGSTASSISSSSSSRSISTTPQLSARPTASGLKKKAKSPVNSEGMALSEAAQVLRALEIANPSSAYSLTLQTKHSKSSLPLRGRVSLPQDPRRTPETILVFCNPSEPSFSIAESAGAHFVGGEDIFPRVLNGEIAPTKVLCTPGMLGAVQSTLARYLGPKGLMPVAKRGGVGEGEDLAVRIREAKGLMEWRGDKLGVVRAPVARVNFSLPSVEANVKAFIANVKEGSTTAATASADATTRSKKSSTILSARLETTNGPSIELTDVL